ncbi:hypothetical protein ACIQPR_07580 [Streptomyces sp. NPDC091280]|uniref:hypothetical protein n=1 Tax=Streptomyces sp. NPDC091280 TaxID=3365984 RepID=UPI00382D98FA
MSEHVPPTRTTEAAAPDRRRRTRYLLPAVAAMVIGLQLATASAKVGYIWQNRSGPSLLTLKDECVAAGGFSTNERQTSSGWLTDCAYKK